MKNLSDVLLQRALVNPTAVAYRFFHGAHLDSETFTYRDLCEQSLALAARFQQNQAPQARLLLVCKSQKNFVLAFFASLLAGMIAVPTAMPRRQALGTRLQLLARDAQISAVVFDADDIHASALEGCGALEEFDLRILPAPSEQESLAQQWVRPTFADDAIAFLQYTSGSTGDPKGVMVSHANLMHNSAVIQAAMQVTPESSVLTALPMFHDMGLVGGLLQPMYTGCVGHWMSPAEFVQYPERWLAIMSRLRITISGGPNFMYGLAAGSIRDDEIVGIDLSAWKTAYCGAEPIRAATIAQFSKRFAPYGFRAEAFYPCYGMAESTLFISGKRAGELPRICSDHGSEVVSCGVAHADTEVRIVDPETTLGLSENAVGEIWVRGRSVAQGYWQRPALTEHAFQARIADRDDGPFLRTGDLGYLKGGELYVTGRLKDLIIVYGKKFVPQDIEAEAEASHAALREGGGAAFAVTKNGVETVTLVLELHRKWVRLHGEWHTIAAAVRQAVHAAYGLTPADVLFIKPGALPRTSSGKVMRSQCRALYLAGELESVG